MRITVGISLHLRHWHPLRTMKNQILPSLRSHQPPMCSFDRLALAPKRTAPRILYQNDSSRTVYDDETPIN